MSLSRGSRMAILLAVFLVGLTCPELSASEAPDGGGTPLLLQAEAAGTMPFGQWNKETLRDSARAVPSLTEPVVSEVLWRVMAAPADLDTVIFFGHAIESQDPAVREVALSFLVGWFSDDSRRILLNTLALEKDTETIDLILGGMARLPRNLAVQGLMDVMFLPGIEGHIVNEAAERLRSLTRESIPDHPGEWRDWWIDNEDRYK